VRIGGGTRKRYGAMADCFEAVNRIVVVGIGRCGFLCNDGRVDRKGCDGRGRHFVLVTAMCAQLNFSYEGHYPEYNVACKPD